MFVDSHTHILKEYYENIDEIISNAKMKNVEYLFISCCSMSDLNESLDIINKYENCYLELGLHPDQTDIYNDDDLIVIEQLICTNKKVVAIGEIGLDYHYGKDNRDSQIKLFKKQLDLAKEYNIPVVIHSRDAVNDTLEILKQYDLNGIIHCFSGSYETACEYIKLGYKIGIGGVVTFKNSKLSDVVSKVDISNIVLETDSPYLTPEPYRGNKNESKNIIYIAEKVSEIKNISIDEIGNITTNNVLKLFNINK